MKIGALLSKDSIRLNGKASGKKAVIDAMVLLMEKGNHLRDARRYKEAVFDREAQGSTGIGDGVAIPHAKTDAVKSPGLQPWTLPEGAEFESLDGQPAHLIFMIAAPDSGDNIHLEVLSRLSMLLMDDGFRQRLMGGRILRKVSGNIDRAETENSVRMAKGPIKRRTGKHSGFLQ